MRETNLMRKPFPWPRSIPITHSSSTLSKNLLVHRAGQCSVEALGQPRLPQQKKKKACAAQCFLLLLLIFLLLLLFSELHYYCYNFLLLRFCCRFSIIDFSFDVCVGSAHACGNGVFFVLFLFWQISQCPQSSPIYDTKAKSHLSESVLKG